MSAITFIRMFAGFDGPLLTCEAVLTEACHLLRTTPNGHDRILEMVQVGGLIVHPMLPTETTAIRGLLSHYKDQGMDFADACIVRLSELHNNCHVITADVQDFRVYRRNGRLTIPLISPHPEFSRHEIFIAVRRHARGSRQSHSPSAGPGPALGIAR